MSTDIIKKGFAAAEKEQQEQEISKIKKIVQTYLEKIQEKSELKDKLDSEVRLLKKDLDDLKAGRLDRIKERSEKDEKAREVTLIIIKQVEREYIPMQPWRSPWIVEWKPFPSIVYESSLAAQTSIANNLLAQSGSAINLCATGQNFANFTSGTYTVGDNVINL